MKRKKRTAGKKSAKMPRRKYKSVLICEETWMLLQDAADLMDEVQRLLNSAAEYDEDFQRSKVYKVLQKKIKRA